jgi:hypothetical protein
MRCCKAAVLHNIEIALMAKLMMMTDVMASEGTADENK